MLYKDNRRYYIYLKESFKYTQEVLLFEEKVLLMQKKNYIRIKVLQMERKSSRP